MRLELEPTVTSPVNAEPEAHFNNNAREATDALQAGIKAAQSGDRARARVLLHNAAEAEPDNVDTWLWLASISEYPEELLAFLDKALAVDPQNERAVEWHASTRSLLAKTFVQRGVDAREDGQLGFALQCFDRAIENDENCAPAWMWRAALTDAEDQKVFCLSRVLEIDPKNDEARSALASISKGKTDAKLHDALVAAANEDRERAKELASEVLSSENDNLKALMLSVHCAETNAEKLAAYERLLDVDPSNAFAAAGSDFLNQVFELVKQPEAAVEDLPEAVSENHTSPVEEADPSDEVSVETAPEQPEAASEPGEEEVTFSSDETQSDSEAEDNVYVYEAPSYHEYQQPVNSSWEAAELPTDIEDVTDHSLTASETVEKQELENEEEVSSAPAEMLTFDSQEETSSAFAPNVVAFPVFDDSQDDNSSETDEIDEAIAKLEPVVESSVESTQESQNDDDVLYFTPQSHANKVSKVNEEPEVETVKCPFCVNEISTSAVSCGSCNSTLSLAYVDGLVRNGRERDQNVFAFVDRLENSKSLDQFDQAELKLLAIGCLNLGEYDRAVNYLSEALQRDPHDVVLASEAHAIAIRVDELRRQETADEWSHRGSKILVVDDSPTVRKLISNKLEKSGHTVICASDGVEAMQAIEDMVPDLVLLDITMPRMDGYQVCKNIRAHERAGNVPVVMISGKDGFFDKVRGRMVGTTGYITKPFGPETLMKALDTYLISEK